MSPNVYANQDLTRSQVNSVSGPAVLEFGANWCGICKNARSLIDDALAGHNAKHIRVEDGPGRPLGRSFQVKLWPTLIFLQDGVELARVVRPASGQDISVALQRLGQG